MSPKIHNYWFKENNIDANFEKKEPKKSLTIVENDTTQEVNFVAESKETVVDELSKLINEYKSNKITKEEFDRRKEEILK